MRVSCARGILAIIEKYCTIYTPPCIAHVIPSVALCDGKRASAESPGVSARARVVLTGITATKDGTCYLGCEKVMDFENAMMIEHQSHLSFEALSRS